jgi:hypothetical protein
MSGGKGRVRRRENGARGGENRTCAVEKRLARAEKYCTPEKEAIRQKRKERKHAVEKTSVAACFSHVRRTPVAACFSPVRGKTCFSPPNLVSLLYADDYCLLKVSLLYARQQTTQGLFLVPASLLSYPLLFPFSVSNLLTIGLNSDDRGSI